MLHTFEVGLIDPDGVGDHRGRALAETRHPIQGVLAQTDKADWRIAPRSVRLRACQSPESTLDSRSKVQVMRIWTGGRRPIAMAKARLDEVDSVLESSDRLLIAASLQQGHANVVESDHRSVSVSLGSYLAARHGGSGSLSLGL